MKIIKLYGMVFENFKGIRKLAVDFKGQDVDVLGDNGSSKTTLFDGFLWVLFGKDSNNRKDFALKTLIDGEEMHNVNHSVELVLEIDGVETTLKRTFKEIYKKARGGIEKTFNGHKTEYEFNGVPCNEKEYKLKVNAIIDEETLKLITNPGYFNALNWQDQRKILFQLVNDSTIDVFATNKDLAPLKPLLDNHSPSELKAIYTAKRKKIKEQVDTIPSRIDELQHMNNAATEDSAEAEQELQVLEKQIDELNVQVISIRNGASVVAIEKEINAVKQRIHELEISSKQEQREELNRVLTKLEEVIGNGQVFKSKKQDIDLKVISNHEMINRYNAQIADNCSEQETLRFQFGVKKRETFEFNDVCECPTCKQSLPDDEVKKARAIALEQFETAKNETLAGIQKRGKALAHDNEELQQYINTMRLENVDLQQKSNELAEKLDKLKKEHEKLTKQQAELQLILSATVESDALTKLIQQKVLLTKQQAELKANAQEMTDDLENEIAILKKKKNDLNLIIGQKAAVQANQKRMAELQQQLQDYIKEFDNVDRVLYLLDEYNRTKVESLSESINNLFERTTFKLFNKLVNGEYEETCEALHDGVPYNKGLNTAARINVGLDIINVLSNYFQVSAPIFIDNAESVTEFIDINGQCVRLYVKEGCKKLEFKGVD